MPTKNYAMAVGYYNDRIYLIGGSNGYPDYNGKAVMIFDPTTKQFTNYFADLLPYNLRAFSNWYTQRDNLLYMSGDYAGFIHIFDLSNNQFTGNWTKAPINGQRFACIAGDDDYLYYLGGETPSTFNDKVQILNLNTAVWANGPSMKSPRGYFACAASPNNRVYAIGGYTDSSFQILDTIEYISTTNIQSNEWIILGET